MIQTDSAPRIAFPYRVHLSVVGNPFQTRFSSLPIGHHSLKKPEIMTALGLPTQFMFQLTADEAQRHGHNL
ncbi:MAG: hypothetical protein PHV34_08420 [Verrucomicrobiae bacterium]|nr:hypothetical protein [Verrucomicrobiae bacterium]